MPHAAQGRNDLVRSSCSNKTLRCPGRWNLRGTLCVRHPKSPPCTLAGYSKECKHLLVQVGYLDRHPWHQPLILRFKLARVLSRAAFARRAAKFVLAADRMVNLKVT